MWVQLYAETKDAGLVCRRCGISRPTLRLWWDRFIARGDEGLISLSRRPRHSPGRVLDQQRIELILALRDERSSALSASKPNYYAIMIFACPLQRSGRSFMLMSERHWCEAGRRKAHSDTVGHCLEIAFRWIR